ncbi:MAG: hypothetical protein ACO1OT_06155 [Heyndrickxia sp.]
MSDEISRVLRLVEDGKLYKEQANELISILQDKGNQVNLQKPNSTPYLDKMLKIRVTSESDNVNVNLPIKLVKAFVKVGTRIAERIPEAEKYVKDIDFDLILEAIENELDGPIVDITSSKEKVLVVIE